MSFISELFSCMKENTMFTTRCFPQNFVPGLKILQSCFSSSSHADWTQINRLCFFLATLATWLSGLVLCLLLETFAKPKNVSNNYQIDAMNYIWHSLFCSCVTYSVWFWTCCIGAGLLDRYWYIDFFYFSVRWISGLFGANIHEWFLQVKVFTITMKYLNICKRDCYNIWYRWSWFPEDESSWLFYSKVYMIQSVIQQSYLVRDVKLFDLIWFVRFAKHAN